MAFTLSLPHVERLRDRLLDQVFLPRLYESLDGADLLDLSGEIARVLLKGDSVDTVFESIRAIAETPLTDPLCLATAWRLAGNAAALKAGIPVGPWSGQQADEWVPVEVLKAIPGRNRRRDIGHHFDFRVLAGTPCPLRITLFWSNKFARFAARKLGFSAPWGRFAYPDPLALVGLRFYGHVVALRSEVSPVFREVSCPDSLWNRNRKRVLRQRLRVTPCPRRYTHACHRCAVGYRECAAGTHRETYQMGPCQFCGTAQAYFDPERSLERCVQCDTRERLRQ